VPVRVAAREFRAGALFLAAGIALTGAYFLLPRGNAQSVVYDVIGVASSLAIAAGVALHRPETPLPWLLFALGNLFFAVADIIFNLLVNPPVPSVADGFYLAGYPLLVAGLAYLLIRSGGHRRLAAIDEAAIVTVAFSLFQWVFLLHGIIAGGGSVSNRAVGAAYPLMDILLLAGLAGFFVTAAWRTPAFLLLVASVSCLLLADEVYGVGPDSYRSGDWIDAGWLLSYVLWAGAALHPSMRELSRPRRDRKRRPRVSPVRVALLTAALLTAPAVLLVQDLRDGRPEIVASVIAATAISCLVVFRLVGILRALERLRLRERDARDQLSSQNVQLLEADRLKDEFVALISHDLRTPLTSIMGYVELALDEDMEEKLDGERRGYLEVVSRSAQRLVRLVDDLLFVARLQAGRLELNTTRLDLTEIVRQAALEAQGRAGAGGVKLVVEANGAVPLEADRGRLFQLLDNLISNAIKFTPAGGRVEVKVSRNGAAVLEVCDTGIGFTSDEAARIFERFFRTDSALEGQIPGTGLGLHIAQAIVEAHGGTITALPRDGGGAVFRIRLPVAS
jgi:signal transduction histidine kinase